MMNANEDAFGHAMLDFYHRKGGYEIVERDDGLFMPAVGPSMYFADYEKWHKTEKEAIRYAKGKVLDIGCGAGRHSIYLQEKGLDVLGIDSSPLAIKVCKLRKLKRAKVMSITQINSALGKFDTLLMLGSNFGLCANYKRTKWLFKRFLSITTPQAKVLAGSMDLQCENDLYDFEQYKRRNLSNGRLTGQFRMRIRYKKFVTPLFDFVYVSESEMSELIEGTGWRIRRFIRSHTQRPREYYTAIIEREN